MATITRTNSIDWGIPGLVGTLGVTVKDQANNVLIARTTAGIVDLGNGQYGISVPNWNVTWGAAVAVDDGTGTAAGTASTWLEPLVPRVDAPVNSGIAGNIWHVSATGNDARDGLSWATAFATPGQAASVAVAGDLIRLGAMFNIGLGTFAPAAGVNVQGSGPRTGITGGVTNEFVTISGNSVFEDFAIIGATGNTFFQFPLAVAGNANAIIRRLYINGQTDCIYGDGAFNATLAAYDCMFVTQWDAVFLQGGGGTTIELHNCTIVSTGQMNGNTGAPFSTGIGASGSTGSMIHVYGGSITAYGNAVHEQAVHTDAAAVWLHGTTVTTFGSPVLTDLVQSGTGTIYVADTGYVPAKTIGTITTAPVDATTSAASVSAIAAAMALAVAGQTMNIYSPLGRGIVTIQRGMAYKAAYNNAIDFTPPTPASWPADLTGWTITFTAQKSEVNPNPGDQSEKWPLSIITASGAGQKVRLELSSTQTANVAPGMNQSAYAFALMGTPPASADAVPLLVGIMPVIG